MYVCMYVYIHIHVLGFNYQQLSGLVENLHSLAGQHGAVRQHDLCIPCRSHASWDEETFVHQASRDISLYNHVGHDRTSIVPL